ncbi:MAG: hypothetical protein J6Y52_06010 [Bacteroidales bacterium]|nr:hypothetical protein [Bacteroidales bacterium]
MKTGKCILFVSLLVAAAFTAAAQEAGPKGLSGRFYTTVGHSYADNYYVAMAVMTDYRPNETLNLTAGLETFRSNGYAATTAWQCQLPVFDGRFFVYNRYLYRLFARWNTNEFSSHVALGYENDHWRVSLGMANRFMSPFRPYDLTGSTDYVFEPFNLMYEVQLRFGLDRAERWHMALRMADFDDFVTDRAYQPLFSVVAARETGPVEVYGRLVCYPTGMLSLSANYYQLFFNLGVRKQW